ncbi:hypothetical protein [Fluviicola taffensis]|uniref:Preprotein translocase subunit SecB n=1 Tax=Fluviicola taffensis (strain DSM 16823 / NCIMB 13979 / RW262) TaxID=755732 RepID=F2IGI5_FLUTR|nr:hypothetical protein [Fluviicola taffensis]AEA42591.1 hypothetical protein Fluta_0587 [Fluviicola taffensis DSM 16823]
MRIKKSPLILHDFYVLDSKYKFNDPGNKKVNIREIFDAYVIDLDFIAKEQKSGETFLFTKISINDIDTSLLGYIMFVEGVSIFSFDKNAILTDKEKSDFIYISGLSIAINNLRTYISNVTSSYPFGKFQLPAVDVGALHADKKKMLKNRKKN